MMWRSLAARAPRLDSDWLDVERADYKESRGKKISRASEPHARTHTHRWEGNPRENETVEQIQWPENMNNSTHREGRKENV